MHDPLVISLRNDSKQASVEGVARTRAEEPLTTSEAGAVRGRRPRTAVLALFVLFALGIGTAGGVVAFNNKHSLGFLASAAASFSGDDTQAIIARVSSLMYVPEGEVPVLARVTDMQVLRGEAFFAHARVGDVVLMYGSARKAILYDPRADKIIEVAPITGDLPTQ